MEDDIDRILVTRAQIATRIEELARQITVDHTTAEGETEITLVPILTGAIVLAADLMRHMPVRMKIGLMTVSSYPGKSLRTQGSSVLGSQLGDIHGRHILLLDDILDSGGTLRMVVPMLKEMGPASVKVCVLLRKDRPAAMETPVDYVGFEIPDEFVVGYGLDFGDYYRNLPDIVTLKKAIYAPERS
ncbi:MAG: hypoxanthine phosphoribosyltransferase [Phycisphaerales bacterium]|jgi:hypoxanthine phosphoribosyltransferase|nr:hypoxanthine phosphoribosyltransferase [Phycisphaerales bacterium]